MKNTQTPWRGHDTSVQAVQDCACPRQHDHCNCYNFLSIATTLTNPTNPSIPFPSFSSNKLYCRPNKESAYSSWQCYRYKMKPHVLKLQGKRNVVYNQTEINSTCAILLDKITSNKALWFLCELCYFSCRDYIACMRCQKSSLVLSRKGCRRSSHSISGGTISLFA